MLTIGTGVVSYYQNDKINVSKLILSPAQSSPLKPTEYKISDVIATFRNNWQMPSKFLIKRGYFDGKKSKQFKLHKELSPAAYNLLNGPLLNPITNSYHYNKPIKHSNDVKTRENGEYPNEYIGEYYFKKIKEKWNNMFNHSNQTSTNTTKSMRTITNPMENNFLNAEVNFADPISKNAEQIITPENHPEIFQKFSKAELEFMKNYLNCLKHNRTYENITKKPANISDVPDVLVNTTNSISLSNDTVNNNQTNNELQSKQSIMNIN